MTEIILCHISALQALRRYRVDGNFNATISEIKELTDSKDKNFNNQKLHILLYDKNLNRKSNAFIYHTAKKSIVKKSHLNIGSKIKCCCPELMLIQLSCVLQFENLCLLILEMCGTYSIDEEQCNFVSEIRPITTIEKIYNFTLRYKNAIPYAKGTKNVLQALKFLKDGSASPMESRLFIKLCGPRTKGFYGCKNLKFNRKIDISIAAQKIAGQNLIIPDIVNLEHKVAIEYDSSKFHENIQQGQKDKRRRDALVYDG